MASKVQGLDALKRKLAALPDAARDELEKAIAESAARVAVLAKALAPVEDGDLRNSIRVEHGRHALARDIKAGGSATMREVREGSGTYYDYAMAQEFGTDNHPAQPYLYPAYRALKKSIKARMSRAYRDAAKKTGGGRA